MILKVILLPKMEIMSRDHRFNVDFADYSVVSVFLMASSIVVE
jgi:hypothetical protein